MPQPSLFDPAGPAPAIDGWLREQRAAAIAVLREQLPRAKAPEALTDAEWEGIAAELRDAMAQIVAYTTALRRLPRTTACVCPRCRVVVLPAEPGPEIYSHCGRLWWPSPAHIALPAGFWETARPGDPYAGAIAGSWAEEEEEHGSQDEKYRRGARSARKKAS